MQTRGRGACQGAFTASAALLISKSRVSNSQKELPLAIKLFQETVQAATKGESKSQRQMLIIAYRASTDSPFGAITPTIEVELS